jgi:hypothetical protein
MPAGHRDNALTGSVGEFLVAAELARRNWVPSITPRGIEDTDVLAQHAETAAVIAVQVKTANGEHFRLKQKNEKTSKQWNQWYVFVSLSGLTEPPRYFVVPTNVVAALVYVDHRGWLRRPGRGGAARHDSSVRAAKVADIKAYENEWELLDAPSNQAPVNLPDRIYDDALGPDGVGWPPDHPGYPRREH